MLSMMVLRDAGKLSLDDEVRKHVPNFKVHNPWSTNRRGITFRQLASHLSGLSRETPCTGDPDGGSGSCAMDDETAFARIAETQLILEPERLPVYSNLGFDVLGHALAIIHGTTYEDMVHQLVILPMGLRNTGVNITYANRSLLAMPYNDPGTSSTSRAASWTRSRKSRLSARRVKVSLDGPACTECLNDFGWTNPSGSMYSTVEDLLAIAALIFRDDADLGEGKAQILEGASIRETLKPEFINSDGSGFGITWELYKVGKYTLRTKRGDVDGYASELIMIPELKLGWVVLANMVEHAQDTAQTLANILLPAFDAFSRSHLPPEPAPPLPLSAYAGLYEPAPGNYANQSVVLSLDPSGTYLTYALTVPALMIYSPQASSASLHVFRLVPWPGLEGGPAGGSCFTTQMEDYWGLVNLAIDKRDGTMRLSADFLWGQAWYKAA